MADQKFKSKVKLQGGVALPAESISRALSIDANGEIKSSATTDVELGRLSGVTSAVQTQLNTAQGDATQALADAGAAQADATQALADAGAAQADATQALSDAGVAQADITSHIEETIGAHAASAISNTPAGDLAATTVQGALDELQTDVSSRILSSEKGANSGVATLNASGKLTSSQVPAIAITDTFVVASEVAMLALVVETGDVAVRTDESKSYILKGTDPTVLADWQELLTPTSPVQSVNGQTGSVVLDTDDISEGTAKYFTDERAQDAVGTILVDSASIDFTYSDGTPSITAVVLPAGVDHDALSNFAANEHIDHSTVSIGTTADSGLAGGGDITASRALSVDITGTTALAATPDSADEMLIWDDSASALKKVTYAELLAGVAVGSVGDIEETSFAVANTQTLAANVTGFAFSNTVVRSFKALVSIQIDATLDLWETAELIGMNKAGSFEMAQSGIGDESGITLSITSGGQVQYTSPTYAGFVSGAIKFRAISLTI